MRWRRRAHQVVLALYAFATLGSVAMVAGPALNDARIQANPGRGTATVTEAGPMRTFVEYQTKTASWSPRRAGCCTRPAWGRGSRCG